MILCLLHSNVTINVALWGDRATTFPADEVIEAGKKNPQIVIFVGTLVRGFGSKSIKHHTCVL